MKLRFFALFCALGFTVSGETSAGAQSLLDNPFSTGNVAGWRMEAGIDTIDGSDPPRIRNMHCAGAANGVTLSMMKSGAIDLRLDSDLHDEGFSTLNIDSVTIGSKFYQASPQSSRVTETFNDVEYPPATEFDIVTSQFIGYLKVRAARDSPWIPFRSMIGNILQSKTIRISYRIAREKCGGKSNCSLWDDESRGTWQRRYATIDVSGLPKALKWCEAAFQSDRARLFHLR